MSNISTISAESREKSGKGASRSLRREGRIPAVIYGGGDSPSHISIEYRLFDMEYTQAGFFSRLYDVDIEGEKTRVLPRDVQLDAVSDRPLHVDFIRYVKGSKITVEVAVNFLGEDVCPGLKRGGVLNVVRRSVELLCPVESIPDMITLDISESDIGDSLHISQINLPDGVDPTITDRDFTIATIAAPTVMTEEEETGDEQDDDTEATADDASSTDAGSDSDETSNDS
jgi:large subunit ribosomal protein L25